MFNPPPLTEVGGGLRARKTLLPGASLGGEGSGFTGQGPWAPPPLQPSCERPEQGHCSSGPRRPPLLHGAPCAGSHQIRSETERAGGVPLGDFSPPPPPVSPQAPAEGPPSQPGASRLRPAEEELPPPPEEPIGFPEREASTGKGTGLGGPGGPSGGSPGPSGAGLGFHVGTRTAGPRVSSPAH